jgi:uncharacterized protein
MLTRRRLLATVPAIGVLSASYAFGVEPRWFETVVQPVRIPGLRDSVRILHLSDFHASFEVPFSLISSAVETGLQAKPDIICLTGDFITRDEPMDWAAYSRILKHMSSRVPTFATLGNHDGGYWAKSRQGHANPSIVINLLRDSGVTVLHNANQVVTTRTAVLRLAGVADLWSRDVDAVSAFSQADSDFPTVLLAHNPDTKDVVDTFKWDLMLSGHTHGGQVLVPLVGDSYVPVRDKRFIAGLKGWNGRQIYVTRGVGSLCSVRFNCRPEVTILDLHG